MFADLLNLFSTKVENSIWAPELNENKVWKKDFE